MSAVSPSPKLRYRNGCVLLIFGLVVSYSEILQPLQEAAQGARRVTWTDNWSFMGVLCGPLGISVTMYPKMLSENSIPFQEQHQIEFFRLAHARDSCRRDACVDFALP